MKQQQVCPVSGRCGGCVFLGTDYLEQLKFKKNKIEKILKKNKIRHIPKLKIFFKDEHFYRNRMDFAFSINGLGLREKGKFYKIVPIKNCFIANKKINSLLCEINNWFDITKENLDIFDIKKKQGTLRYAVIRASYFLENSTVTFILNKDSERINEQKEFLIEYSKKSMANNILLGYVKYNSDLSSTDAYEVIKGSDLLRERLKGFIYFYHSQGFFQNNCKITEDIMEFLKSKINERYDLLLDFYGGVGTFGIFLYDRAEEIIIADNNKINLSCAEKNINENKLLNAKILTVEDSKPNLLLNFVKEKKTVLVVDPPRAGLHKNTLKFIIEILPEKIFYISCNPKQMVKDIAVLMEKYNLKEIVIFDMFPQTEHTETIAILEKIK